MSNILIDLIKNHSGRNSGINSTNGLTFFWDIDLTLADTMAINTTPAQQALFRELYVRMGGKMVVMTGRSSDSVEKTLSGEYPGSFEHHSAIRTEQNGSIIALAPEIDTFQVAKSVTIIIDNEIKKAGINLRIAQSPNEVRSAEGKFPLVYPEVKRYAVALVHSLGHGHVNSNREIFKKAATETIASLGLSESHTIAIGNDAIEIVPKGLDCKSLAYTVLSQDRIERLTTKGLNKGQGLHDFMSFSDFKGTVPFVIGDSGTDGKAMNKAHKYYGGGGVWVLNGKVVPDEFARAVSGRTVENFMRTWDEIDSAVKLLREKQRVYPVCQNR
jgi:hypothetical protein